MARTISTSNVINIVDLVNSFNDNLWTAINSTIGGKLYSNDTSGTKLSSDTYTDTSGNTQTISSSGVPQFTRTAYIAANSTKGTGSTIPVKNACPPNHLRTLSGKGRQYYTLKWSDIADTQTGTEIKADDVYNACYAVLYRLITIRPMYSTWVHEATNATAGYPYEAFTETQTYYGVFKRSDLEDASALNTIDKTKVYPTTSVPNAYYYWESYAKGADFSIFSATDTSLSSSQSAQAVGRNNCISGVSCLASNINKEVQTFWSAWTSKCQNKNKFTYKYHTCHLSCHSSCWCHSSRGRR